MTVSLSFHLLKGWSRKLSHSVAAILSHFLSISQYLPLEVSPEQFLLWYQGSKEATRPRRAGELKGLGLSSLCVYRSWNTHGPQPEGKWSSVQSWKLHSETILSSGLSAVSFLLFFPLMQWQKDKHTDVVKCSEQSLTAGHSDYTDL